MFTSWSEQSTPAELSIASMKIRPPPSANSTRARCVKPRFPPSPTTRQRSSRASTRTASFVLSPTSACRSSSAFTYVPIPPFQSRSTGARSTARISSFGVSDVSSTPSAARASGESVDRLRRAREDAAAGRDQRRVVVRPRRARQPEEPLALGEARGRVGVGSRKTCRWSNAREQLDVAREQHPVAEDVARHVADPDHGEVGASRCRRRARGSAA